MSIEEKYVFTRAEDSVISKDWAAGSSQQLETTEMVIKKINNGLGLNSYAGTVEKIKYAPAWWKIIDEPIVNALDHMVRCVNSANCVTVIKIDFNQDGKVRIYNNGPGVEIVLHQKASEELKRPMWVPTFIFGTLFQGSNRERGKDSIIGGTNGMGAKLSNCFSTEFTVETVDQSRNMYFLQRWRDHKKIEDDPFIVDLSKKNVIPADRKTPHTLLSFIPDYEKLFGYKEFNKEIYNVLVNVVRTRAFYASVYAHYTAAGQQKIEVYFNDELIPAKSMDDIAKIMFPGKDRITTTINPAIDLKKLDKDRARDHYKYSWEVSAVLLNTNELDVKQLSNVNGVVVREGKHTAHLFNNLCNSVREKISKILKDKNLTFSSNHISGNVFLFVNAKIPNPSWTGQRKDVLDLNIRHLVGYNFDVKFINNVCDKLKTQILDNIFNETEKTSKQKKSKIISYEKYTPAKKSGGKDSQKCTLIMVEGDAAKSSAESGIAMSIGFDYYGVMATGGVIINSRKECKIVDTISGAKIKKSTKLVNNLFMNALTDITGLNSNYKYDKNSLTYKKEINDLKYGNITACVDQDLDGKGNILGLLLNTMELFWPNLLRDGYVKWFCTPIIRAYPKSGGIILEFYNVADYDQWITTVDVRKYNIKYYKGIGTHNRTETIDMFKKFSNNLYTYYLDNNSHELFEIYFGKDPELRKKELSTPTKTFTVESQDIMFKSKQMSCSDHLQIETNVYQKDNVERKLDHFIDGQNQSGRKIVDGIIKALSGNKTMKVAQLGGYIAEHENYHHGEASLCDSITGKGLITTGGKQLPLIIPEGNFGSRKGNDAAPPRYIFAKLNKRLTSLLFPDDDYHILPFKFDEGVRGEPKYFVPIIPLAVCESAHHPAHGWKLKLWARDVTKVIENVVRLIRLGDNVELLRMPPCIYKGSPYEWKGQIKNIRGDAYSFGEYKVNKLKNTVTITELPLRVWTTSYSNMLKKKSLQEDNNIIAINGVHDSSGDTNVNIEVKLKSGAFDLLENMNDSCFSDGIEEYFQLRNHMESHINLYGPDDAAHMFKSYEEVVHKWFPVRKLYYKYRIERKCLLLKLNIRLYENIIRYVENSIKMDMPKRKYLDMVTLLSENSYDKIYKAKLITPGFTATCDLENLILKSESADYDYLLDLSDKKKSLESLDNYETQLLKLREELKDLELIANKGRFPGAAIWENELEQLLEVIKVGHKTFWNYEDSSKFKFA